MAYLLHQRWAGKYHVVREWPVTRDSTSRRRVDFGATPADFRGKNVAHPLELSYAFELKSFYSYDIVGKGKCGLFTDLAAAIRTVRQPDGGADSLHPKAKRFALLSVTHLHCDPEATAVQLLMKSYRPGVQRLCSQAWDANRFDPTARYAAACKDETLSEPRLICARYSSSSERIHGATVTLGYWLYSHD